HRPGSPGASGLTPRWDRAGASRQGVSSMPRCAECGFLSVIPMGKRRELLETDAEMRGTWNNPPGEHRVGHKMYEDWPVCFARAFPLREEVGQFSPARVLEVIRQDRACTR